ncbi:MAG TPA: hypothetical protein VGM84_14365 [Steroidobacteraceae bacterium]|jgi:hypothetical protein
MSAVLVAVFNSYEVASRVRVQLFRDGFPTDRVELTARCEMGRAGIAPAELPRDKFYQYFRTLFSRENEREFVEGLVQRIENGGATITVHPRGMVETTRATELLIGAEPVDMLEHDLAHQPWEYAASNGSSPPWITNFWLEPDPDCHCIYCRLFEGGSRSNAGPQPAVASR